MKQVFVKNHNQIKTHWLANCNFALFMGRRDHFWGKRHLKYVHICVLLNFHIICPENRDPMVGSTFLLKGLHESRLAWPHGYIRKRKTTKPGSSPSFSASKTNSEAYSTRKKNWIFDTQSSFLYFKSKNISTIYFFVREIWKLEKWMQHNTKREK